MIKRMATLNPLSSRIHAVIKPLTPPPMTTCFDELLSFFRGWLVTESATSGTEVDLSGKMIVVSDIVVSLSLWKVEQEVFQLGEHRLSQKERTVGAYRECLQ